MANNKTTVTQGYLEGVPHVIKFLEKEIGSEKAYEKEMAKIKAIYDELTADGEELDEKSKAAKNLEKRMEAMKAGYHRVYAPMKAYGKTMTVLFKNKTIVDKNILGELIRKSHSISEGNIFTIESLKWNSEAGANAMKKFTDMIIENDLKKYQYYYKCLDKAASFKGMPLENVIERPLPKLKNPEPIDKENLTNAIAELSEKLNAADAIIHKDSKEYKAMKAAVKSLNEALTTNLSENEIGSRLEALQAASMTYVKAKGVGMQSSDLGKERMDIALDLCATATKYMDCYASEARIQEIKDFEKDIVGKEFSQNGTFDYTVNLESEELLKVDAIEDEIENDEMRL